MLTHMRVKNFKNLKDVEIELGKSVVLIGPNNSGKTTALQALTLWDTGLKQWDAKRSDKGSPEKRPGVSIGKNELTTMEEVLLAYARGEPSDDLFWPTEAERRMQAMRKSIEKVAEALETLHGSSPWSVDVKATDDFLDPVFEQYFKKIELPNLLSKSHYHKLAGLVPKDKIDSEIVEALDEIVAVEKKSRPRKD